MWNVNNNIYTLSNTKQNHIQLGQYVRGHYVYGLVGVMKRIAD